MARAAQAAELLENPLLVEALAAFDKEVIEAWKTSPARDQEGREKLFLMLQARQKFEAHLQSLVNTGKLLSLKPPLKERLSRVVGLS